MIDFGTGTAIYFYDPSGNIVEFIDRASLNKHSSQRFSAEEVVCMNATGIPLEDTATGVKRFVLTF
jgi:catechol-2,3-dioxygenase